MDGIWGEGKIRGLLEGYITLMAQSEVAHVDDAEMAVAVDTAYEIRCRVLDGSAHVDTLLDTIQLSKSIASIRDPEVRAFMAAAISLGCMDAWTAEAAVADAGLRTTRRRTTRVWERGLDLIRLEENARSAVARALKGTEKLVCYRCLENEVEAAGELCGDDCRGVDEPATWKTRDDLSDWDLDKLVETQESGHVPGWTQVRDFETPVADMDDALDYFSNNPQ